MGTEPSQEAWDGVLRRHVDITIRSVNAEARSVDVVASTASLDSHSTILDQDWRLERYRKNPVVLWCHNRFEHGPLSLGGGVRPEDFLPIGRSENVGVVGGQLEARIVFASAEANPLADRIFKLMREGILHSVSVGFRAGTVTEEKFDGREILRLGKNELYEISVVPVPSNPDAVAKSIAFETEQLGRLVAAARAAGVGERETHMAMTAEEKAAFDAALADAKDAKAVRERIAALETELAKERAIASDARETIKKLTDEAAKAQERIVEFEVDKLIGKKFLPAEREKQIAFARKFGLDAVLELAAVRADIKLTEPVSVDGKPLTSATQPTPPPVDESRGDAGADIVNTAMQAANAAA
jgi:hypothetical protein